MDYMSTVLLGWRTEEMRKFLSFQLCPAFFSFSELWIEFVWPLIKHQVHGKAVSLLSYFYATNKEAQGCFVT